MIRSRDPENTAEGGWNTMELMVAVAIVSVGLLVMLQQLSISYRESEHNEERAFAFQKAAAILQEIQNGIDQGSIAIPPDLFALVDTDYNVVLTTRRDEEGLQLPPEHPMSGNRLFQQQWTWSRRVNVEPHVNAGLYYVKVDIHQRRQNGAWGFQANQSQLVSLIPDADAPAQVFDVYVLALGTTPSLWTDLSLLRTEIVNAAKTLEQDSRARFRLHWITSLGYGRDLSYAPYVNETTPATEAAPWAYWYPGLLGGIHAGGRLYRSELIRAVHRTEEGLVNGYSSENPIPVTVADHFNHAMRGPAAKAVFQARVDAGLDKADEPPLQVLLDLMHEDPDRFRGAIFVNLHGTGMPTPPLRNYSDAAKDPTGRPGIRVVTHPARLQTPRDPNGDGEHDDSEDLELRVYAFKEDPGSGPAVLTEPILVQVFAPIDLSAVINGGGDTTLQIRRLPGGVSPVTGTTGGDGRAYEGFDSSTGLAPSSAQQPYGMYYTAGFVGGFQPHTWIRLYNTPLVAPVVGDGGLTNSTRLYGMDYIPSPVAADGFTRDLAAGPANWPKNTARWRIRLPKHLLTDEYLGNQDRLIRVVTRIGNDLGTGQRWPVANQPRNVSETWAWWTSGRDAVPISERAQFLGDPRHNPYADLGTMAGAGFAHGYNWNFDDLVNGSQNAVALWPCIDGERLQDGFGTRTRADAPRFFQLWRRAVEQCSAIWVNPTGRTASYLLLGGDIVRPTAVAATELEAVELHRDYGGGSALVELDTVSVPEDRRDPGGDQVLVSSTDNWWSRPWLGELCPDAGSYEWSTGGNVALGQVRWRGMHAGNLPSLPAGTRFGEAGAEMGDAGALVLLNCGTPSSTYLHVEIVPTSGATPTAAGRDILDALNVVVPTTLPSGWPFSVTAAYPDPPNAYRFTDSFPRTTAGILESHVAFPGMPAVASVAFGLAANTRGYLVPMGSTPAAADHDEIGRQALASGLRTLHAASLANLPGRIPGVPLPSFVEPTAGLVLDDPSSLLLRWGVDWRRFDGSAYTAMHPVGFTESESDLVYRILASRDGGTTWTNVLTQVPTEADVFPTSTNERVADLTAGYETFAVATPSETYPGAEYLFRVEAYTLARQTHAGWHQVRVLVRRNNQ